MKLHPPSPAESLSCSALSRAEEWATTHNSETLSNLDTSTAHSCLSVLVAGAVKPCLAAISFLIQLRKVLFPTAVAHCSTKTLL